MTQKNLLNMLFFNRPYDKHSNIYFHTVNFPFLSSIIASGLSLRFTVPGDPKKYFCLTNHALNNGLFFYCLNIFRFLISIHKLRF